MISELADETMEVEVSQIDKIEKKSKRLFIKDKMSNLNLFVDSGNDISVIRRTEEDKESSSSRLLADLKEVFQVLANV